MKRLLTLPLVALMLALSAVAPVGAELGPSTYRTKELSAADRATHGDEVLHGFVDGWYEGRPLHHWAEAHPDTLAQHGHEAVHAWIVTYWERQWVEAYERNAAAAEAARIEAERAAHSSGQCGGDLPPCWVMHRESKGDIRIWNGGCYNGPCRGGSTASGKWQFVRGTWGGFGGYRNAADAPEQVQDAKARHLWAGGRGCSHWSAC